MAKQIGIHGLKGKVDGMSYYSSKNGGRLTRSINEGMSSRVKTAKEYANTRKNNSEFGMCGDLAGSIIKPFSLRWRFILDSIATGKMVKVLKELVILDSTGAWGQRVLKNTYFDQIRAAFNSFSKNEMPSDVVSTLAQGVDFDDEAEEIHVANQGTLSESTISEMLAEGINYFYLKVFAFRSTVPSFDTNVDAYTKAEYTLEEVTQLSHQDNIAVGASINLFGNVDSSCKVNPIDATNVIGGLAVVFLPARKVGTSISILQQHCSAYMVPVTATA